MIELVIITGVYGAGKTTSVLSFEEAGYFITDNIPVGVVDDLLQFRDLGGQRVVIGHFGVHANVLCRQRVGVRFGILKHFI